MRRGGLVPGGNDADTTIPGRPCTAQHDRIRGWHISGQGSDRIDLSAIDADSATAGTDDAFIGGAAFSGMARAFSVHMGSRQML